MKYCQDSREIRDGDIFIALPGENTDGHNFIEKALENGAAKIVFHEETYKDIVPESKQIFVLDTESWLHETAISQLRNPTIVTICGSVGKTTTALLLHHIITHSDNSYKSHCFYPKVGINTLRGICLEIVNEYQDEKLLLLETAMDSFLELDVMAEILKPQVSAIISIDISHFEKLKSMQRIIRTEFGMCTQELDHFVYNAQDKLIADFMKSDFSSLVSDGTFKEPKHRHPVKKTKSLTIEPEHLLVNLSMVLSILDTLDISTSQDELQQIIDSFETRHLRFQIEHHSGTTILNDSYNAAPISFDAFFTYSSKQKGPKLGIIGQINEIGPLSEKVHSDIVAEARSIFDELVLVGPELNTIANESKTEHWFDDHNSAANYLKLLHKEGSFPFVGIKGSRGIELDRIVENVWGQD